MQFVAAWCLKYPILITNVTRPVLIARRAGGRRESCSKWTLRLVNFVMILVGIAGFFFAAAAIISGERSVPVKLEQASFGLSFGDAACLRPFAS